MKLQLAGVAALTMVAGGFFGSPASAADTEVVVTPADVGTSWHTADTRPPGTGTFVDGPTTPPEGTGSFRLQTLTNPEKVQMFTDAYDGVALANIDGIGYSTYRDPASTGFEAGVAALNVRVDHTGDGNPDAYLVYEPYQAEGNAAVQTGVWQDWDAYKGGQAEWWLNTGAGGCGQATPCTWDEIVAALPGITIEEGANCGSKTPCPGSLGFNQGSFNSGIISNVDALYVGVSGNTTTYDFELTLPDSDGDGTPDSTDNCPELPNPGQENSDDDADGDACDTDDDNDGVLDGDDAFPTDPTEQSDADGDGIGDNADPDDDNDGIEDGIDTDSKEDCKNGGWKNHTSPTFKNQGQCVSFYARA